MIISVELHRSGVHSRRQSIPVDRERLDRLLGLSGLTGREREMVAQWRVYGIPQHHRTSFMFLWKKHCGGAS